jgi:hypothetical protein
VYGRREFAEAGGLMVVAYGPNLAEMYQKLDEWIEVQPGQKTSRLEAICRLRRVSWGLVARTSEFPPTLSRRNR